MDLESLVIGIVSAVGATAIIGLVSAVIQTKGDIKAVETRCNERCKKIDDVSQLHDDVLEMKTRMDVFWKTIEPKLAEIIHSPIHVRRDALVDKFVNKSISIEEAKELIEHLEAAYKEEVRGDRKFTVTLLTASVSSHIVNEERKLKKEVLQHARNTTVRTEYDGNSPGDNLTGIPDPNH